MKVFGIGFHKTGTTTLGIALERIGYSVCHGARPLREVLGDPELMALLNGHRLGPILDVAQRYDAFEDNPWFLLYRELDERFPGSKFILTMRDETRWIESARRYFGRTTSDLREWIYGIGSPVGNEARWLERYRQHNEQVRQYFRTRPRDLLVVDWEQGHGWGELAGFLGRERPSPPFPHANATRAALPPLAVRPANLSRGIFVLAHPRTGSSLIMQTLRLLGVPVVGDAWRSDLPDETNPRGFFEDPHLLRLGLYAPAVADRPDLFRGTAVKLGLRELAHRASSKEWSTLARSDAALLIPIRAPAESLASQAVLVREKEPEAARSRHFRAFVRCYLTDMGFLASRVLAPDFMRPPPVCIDYRQAIEEPAAYVRALAAAARVDPTPGQVADAMANIDNSLYRLRAQEGEAVRRAGAGLRPLDSIHEVLRSEDPRKWERVRRQLPRWAIDAAR